MRRLIALLTLAVAACGQQPDGYEFEGKEFERRQQQVSVTEHDTLEDLRASAPASAKDPDRALHGFSYIHPDRCEIHVTNLRKPDARMWLGHELTHCIYGRWHSR